MSPAATTTQTLRLSRTFPGKRERLFRAWTEAEEIAQWFRPTDDYVSHVVAMEARPGGVYTIEMRHKGGNVSRVTGRYLEVSAPERLVFTWLFETQPNAPETLVTVEFREAGENTELTLTHERFPSEEQRTRHEWGWTGSLDQLARRMAR